MPTDQVVLALVSLFALAIKEVLAAGQDAALRQAALMRAEEAFYQLRIQTKFGGH